MAGKGGGAWKVAYADFVTAMMAFFLVMWITSQGEDVKEAVAHSFREPFEPIVPGDGYPPQRGNDRRKGERGTSWTPTDEREAMDARTSRVLVMRRGEDSGAGTVIFFAEDAIELDDRAIHRLRLLLPQVIGKPHLIEIRGHASRRPLPLDSPYEDAWHLSYERCLATMKFLEAEGVPRERIRLSQAAGYEPFTAGSDLTALSLAPRVEVIVLGQMVEPFGDVAEVPKTSSVEVRETAHAAR